MIKVVIGISIILVLIFAVMFAMLCVSEKYDEDLECFDIDKLYKKVNKSKKRKRK